MNRPLKRNVWKRVARIVLKTILFLFLFFILIVVLILTPPVQNFIRKKTVAWLETKLQTRVEVGRVYIGLPKNIVLEDVYIEDRQKDTLISGGLIKADMAILKLIFRQELEINSIKLENITAKIKRQLPDTSFNFQFVVDAFAPAKKDTLAPAAIPDTTSTAIAIGSITIDKSHLVYNDVITGSDMEAWIDHFDTKVNRFDPVKMDIDIPSINVNGLTARIYQHKPLEVSVPDTAASPLKTPVYPQIVLDEIDLQKVVLDYRNDVSALYTSASIGSLLAELKEMDMAEQIVDLNTFSLKNTTAALRLGRKEEARELAEDVQKTADSTIKKGWRMQVASFLSENNNLQFDNDNLPHQKTGMDYAHLKATPLNLQASNFLLSNDTVSGTIDKASFKEQSGFELQELTTTFLYSGKEAYLHDLYLKTPGTELKRNAEIAYYSLDVFTKDIGNLRIDLDLNNSRLLVSDLLTFAPMLRSQPAFANPGTTWFINSRIQGRVADLDIDALQVRGLQDTRINIAGRVTGLPDINKFSANLAIRNISSSRRDINLFLPAKLLPQNITLPNRFNMTGNVNGNTRALTTNISVNTDLGNAAVKGNIQQLNDPRNIKYDATLHAGSLDLGTILQDRQNLGTVTATFAVNGRGTDPKSMTAGFSGTVHSAVLKQYNYRNLKIKGQLANQQFVTDASIIDPNIHLTLNATANTALRYPSVQLTAMIDSIKMHELNLTPDPFIYRGKIDADFASTNPDDLVGTAYLTQNLMVQNEKRVQLDTVILVAARTDSGHSLQVRSDIIYANLSGEYKLTQMGGIFQQAIQPYFAVAPGSMIVRDPYNFTLNASVVNGAPLQAFFPALQRMDSMILQSRFSSTAGWTATVTAPSLDYGINRIRGLELKAGTAGDSIKADVLVRNFTSGTMEFFNSTITASLADNVINFTLDTKDRADRSRYNFTALFEQPQRGYYSFSFAPEGLLLNYERWTISADNELVITPRNVIASDFVLTNGTQQLGLNSISQGPYAPLQANFVDFRLSTITAFVQSDSTLVDGRMNGAIQFTNILTDPVFEGKLNINDLSIKNDTVGNAEITVNNTTANVYAANAVLTGRGNDVRLDGRYYFNGNGSSRYDLDLNVVNLPMATVEAFSNGAIRSASGNLKGNFDITGTVSDPDIRGEMNFDKASFNVAQFNSHFRIDGEQISVNNQGIVFDQFIIKDSLNNTLVLNGTAATTNFRNYRFNFTVRANNFQMLNSTRQDNNLFYGQLFFNTNLRVTGTEATPVVDGNITVNEKTKMTIVLPQREPGIVQREGVIEFIDRDAPLNDSLFLSAYDSLNTVSLRGLDVATNIEVNKEAEFNLIIDEGNGDFLNVKGEASLTSGIDPSGKLTLAGAYELEQGSYELSFNMIRRKFNIDKGSRITWLGEPTDAEVDITARYIANAAPLDLVKNDLGPEVTGGSRNIYLQRLPFNVLLDMEGKLLKPQIKFDIILPEDRNYAVANEVVSTSRAKLDIIRQEPGEINKQVFALLLLNRFIGENPFSSSTDMISANTFARQSVSKLLTEQLNHLAEDLIEGVDLNFDVISSEDYTTGERRDRTDLNVGLSKQLLNDRLSVSVGSNFELEGPQNSNQQANNIAGNIALDYRVSSDGRYLLRAYRKNEYEGIIDGYVIETGVSFIISVDYNRFRQIFLSKEDRERRRKTRQENRRQRRQNANAEVEEAKRIESGQLP
jgi:translocation and assembly module TamB